MEKPTADNNSKKRRNFEIMILLPLFIFYAFAGILIITLHSNNEISNTVWTISYFSLYGMLLVSSIVVRRAAEKKYPKQSALSEIEKY
jgi:hypothetical protein